MHQGLWLPSYATATAVSYIVPPEEIRCFASLVEAGKKDPLKTPSKVEREKSGKKLNEIPISGLLSTTGSVINNIVRESLSR